jgi:non-structural maintenance of chromosomes element 4
MARLNTRRSPSRASSLYRDPTPSSTHLLRKQGRTNSKLSPSPSTAASFSSDKENREDEQQTSAARNKEKAPMAPSILPTPTGSTARANKRRRLGERDGSTSTTSPTANIRATTDDIQYYDPEQDPDERREVRLSLRNNARELHERHDELINTDGIELRNLIEEQNKLYDQVRQTSDATIDSRFLLSASDLTLKRTTRLAHGDGSVGVDIDEFVSKCITFMCHGGPLDDGEEESVSTQARRRRQSRPHDDDDDDDDEEINDGDAMAWDILGERACFPCNKRPPVPGFLLGPLSVQKRVRTTQRQSRLRREADVPVSKPQELRAEDLEQNETSNLTNVCKGIRERLKHVIDEGAKGVEQDISDDVDMDEAEARALFRRHGLATNWEVSLFQFAVNPYSFGQTIENLFYISFLVKDGYVALDTDDDGLPTLRCTQPSTASEMREKGATRHQAIFSLDFKTWRKLIAAFDITEPLIPHRKDEQRTQMVGNRGWYG